MKRNLINITLSIVIATSFSSGMIIKHLNQQTINETQLYVLGDSLSDNAI